MKSALRIMGCCICLWLTASVYAEEMLEKPSGRFLGWQMNATDFTDCDNNRMKISPGTVKKTFQKCRGTVFSMKDNDFRVESVDLNKRTFSAINLNTKSKVDFFYPEAAENPGTVKLDVIKPGQRLGINYYDPKAELWGPTKRVEVIKAVP